MFEIFISYKHTDNDGSLSEDYYCAKELYTKLEKTGYSVFFSDRSIKEMGESDFDKLIDKALDECKVMIVVLTDVKQAESKWVSDEYESFHKDIKNNIKPDGRLFTYTKGVNTNELPRKLRNVQNYEIENGYNDLAESLKNIFKKEKRFRIKEKSEITFEDIEAAVELDGVVFSGMEHVDPKECLKWFNQNPYIYLFAEEISTNRIVAYTNTAPVTDECYEMIKSGTFLTTNITDDMLLTYDMPGAYSLYFFSVVIAPEFRNTELLNMLIGALAKRFKELADQEKYVRRMIADAVTIDGEHFCELFRMKKITSSTHESKLYEIKMIPPEFRVINPSIKELKDLYKQVYEEKPYLFDED